MSDYSHWTPLEQPSELHRAYRILDANLNRSMEGMRVVEDCLRYGLNAQSLVRQSKEVRHRLGEISNSLSQTKRVRSRDLHSDVGTTLETPTEYSRSTIRELILANSERVKQSLRTLEETSKLSELHEELGPSYPKRFEQLRYDFYVFEQAVLNQVFASGNWTDRVLYVLKDARASELEFTRLISELIEAEVDVVQLRDKQLEDRSLKDRAEKLVELTRGTGTLAIINDRPDVAAIVGADGVHVGQTELGVGDCRRVVGLEAIVGLSTHSQDQAVRACSHGADYLGVGPVFPSKTKVFLDTQGLALIESVADVIDLPWFAIGGIDEQNIESVLDAGARRIAMSNAIVGAECPGKTAKQIKQVIDARGSATFERGPNA